MKVSACIIAMNEEAYIARAINNLKKIELVEEIIIVDGGSTDYTVKICEQLGCKVVYKKWEQDFASQRNFAMSLCKNDWVVWLDADEWYSEKLRSAISVLLPALPDRYAAIRTHEITEVHVDDLNAPPFDPSDISKYVSEYSDPNFCRPDESFTIYVDGYVKFLTYTYRIVNKTRGSWRNKIHEIFEIYPQYQQYVLPYEYSIHHQKSYSKQRLSNSKYFDIDFPTECVYRIDYDDFVDGTSQKSIRTLDDIFFRLVTEVAPCDYFIEAGAFQGETSISVQNALPNASVFAFEANPYNYEQFKHLFDNSTAKYINLAVSGTNDSVLFKVQKTYMDEPLSPIRGNNSMLLRTEPGVGYEDVTVNSTTLNNYFADKIKPGQMVAAWIDLEGAAYEALLGSVNVLPNIGVIKIEVEKHQFWENQKLDFDIRALLSQYGFFPVLRDYEYPNQYNILFCKSEIMESESFQSLVDEYGCVATTWNFKK